MTNPARMIPSPVKICAVGACLCLLLFAMAGCPATQPVKEGTITALVTADSPAAGGAAAALASALTKADVPVEDIVSLKVTVTKIVLVQGDGEQEEENSDDLVEVFNGSMEVDLINVEALARVDVSAGTYNQIKISIENPRMTLVSNPEEELTNIHLTANSRLFITQQFEVPEGESLLLLDFDGAKIVELGNSDYNWTPQLHADLTFESAEVNSAGTIESIDETAQTFVLTLTEGTLVVDFSGASIYLPEDTDTPSGVPADLVVGAEVEVEGLLNLEGLVEATVIRILPVEEPVEEP